MEMLFLDLAIDSMHDLVHNANFTGIVYIVNGELGSGLYTGDICYFVNGEFHKEDGPAIVSAKHKKYDSFMLYGQWHTRPVYWSKQYEKYKNTDMATKIMAEILSCKNE